MGKVTKEFDFKLFELTEDVVAVVNKERAVPLKKGYQFIGIEVDGICMPYNTPYRIKKCHAKITHDIKFEEVKEDTKDGEGSNTEQ